MARQIGTGKKHETGRNILTKTPYGISSDMIVSEQEILEKVQIPENCVLVRDDMGYFIVNRNRVNDGLACPLRYDQKFRQKSNVEIMEMINE
jgi:hypothetical protein